MRNRNVPKNIESTETVSSFALPNKRTFRPNPQLGENAKEVIGGAVDLTEIEQQVAAAANAAEEALEKADIAYDNASYWSQECVVSSAEVLLGVNELLIGMVMDVPTGRTRIITDMHFALYEKPGTLTVETRLIDNQYNSRQVHAHSILANVTRVSLTQLNIPVLNKERIYWNVLASSQTATILQVAVAGVLL